MGHFFSVMLWVANDGGQFSDRCWKVSIVPSISVLQRGRRSLWPHVILLISPLSCFPLLRPRVLFFPSNLKGQVVLGSSKPFFCSAVRDFILFWLSANNTAGLKLYFALFTAHCWAACAAASTMSAASQLRYLITLQLNGVYFFNSRCECLGCCLLLKWAGGQSGRVLFPLAVTKCITFLFTYPLLKRAQVTVSRTASPPPREGDCRPHTANSILTKRRQRHAGLVLKIKNTKSGSF